MDVVGHFSSEHWWISLLYFAPVFVALAAIGVSAWRARGEDPDAERDEPTRD